MIRDFEDVATHVLFAVVGIALGVCAAVACLPLLETLVAGVLA